MTIKNVVVEFTPTAEDLANELWQMGCGHQIDFLLEMARNSKFDSARFHTHLQHIADELNYDDDNYCKDLIIRMLKTVLDYVDKEKEREENK